MKGLLLAGAFLGVIGYAWFSGGDPNVYPMTQAEAYRKLTTSHIPSDGKSAFGTLTYSASGNGTDKVYWNGSGGTFATSHCEAEITPEGKDKSRIMAFCNGGGASDGAAAGMVSGMQRRALIEHIDATLTGRAFDKAKSLGSTAARWPSDARQPDGSYGTMVGDALKMDHDMHSMQAKADAATLAMENGGNPTSPSQATKPMTDLGSSNR